ncbi:hypothetical protein ACFOYW_06455 [Gryllotalpicola reticulitermitis]|uniref:PIN domain-containing protein n=1 Tax=Gryllotalpicola reticulitermitis TaxID=1184153 RepID=A0ABV8Q3K5_9MICO
MIVADRRAPPAARLQIERALATLRVEVVPFTIDQARVAREAYRVFGKGSGSGARLNLGGTYSCALAAVTGESLLFVGDGFAHTDIRAAL